MSASDDGVENNASSATLFSSFLTQLVQEKSSYLLEKRREEKVVIITIDTGQWNNNQKIRIRAAIEKLKFIVYVYCY